MKVSTTNDNGGNAFARNLMAPIPFYPTADSSSGPTDKKSYECDCDVMVHKVCYNPTNTDSQMYKIYLNPFDTGSVEQWLKFLTKLNLIITRNGLMASLVKFNLMQLLLSTNKAQELGDETNVHHKLCLNVVSAHIFPKNALQMQKCYSQKVCLSSLTTISEYFSCWHQQNDYLALFPLHGRVAQMIRDDEITIMSNFQIA